MNILMIGNSFSVDVSTYVHSIAEDINIYVLYIGGCSIKRHYQNLLSEEKAYEFYVNGSRNPLMWCSLQDGLKFAKYDYITFQQVSSDSGDYNTYFPELNLLMDGVRRYSDAKFILHMTWSYAKTHSHEKYGSNPLNQEMMSKDIFETYEKVSKRINIPFIIPTGKTIYEARKIYGDDLTRDGYHLNERGRTVSGYLLAYYFLGLDIDVSKFRPTGKTYDDVTEAVDEKELTILQDIAKKVLLCNKGHNLNG